MSMPAGRRADP